MTNAPDFAYWAGTTALGLDADGRFEQVLPEAVQQAELQAKLGGDPPSAALLAWPTREAGLMICIKLSRDGGANEFVVAWPFASTGVAHRMTVGAIHADEDCDAIRLIEGDIDGVPLVALDTLCATASAPEPIGEQLVVRLHAWATKAERAPTEPIRYHPEDVNESMREAFRETFERDGELVLHTDQLVALFPRGDGPTPLYEFRSPVKAVRDGRALPDMNVWVLTLAVARPDDGDATIDIELSVTSAVWTGDPPQPGDAVQGLLWLQARVG